MGAVWGGLLPDLLGSVTERVGFSVYDVSYAASLAVMLGVFIYTLFVIAEKPRPLNPQALKRGFTTVPLVIRDASLITLRNPALSMLLAALVFFLMATNPVEVIWPTHAKPMLEEGYANAVIGILTAAYFFSIAFGASLSPRISRIFRRRHTMTLAAAFACLAGFQIALALQGSIVGFVTVFILYSVFLGVSETPASSILHRCVEDRQRSTMLSLRSLVQQLGAALGLILAGFIAEVYSTPTAWVIGSVFLVLAVLLISILAKRLTSEND
jgi:MFS family permease